MTSGSGPPSVDAGSSSSPGGSRWSFRLRLNLAGGVVLLTVVIGWVIAYQMTRRMAESAERVAHTHEVIASIRGAAGALQEAETAHRDYLLSSHSGHLERYTSAAGVHREQVDRLRTLTGDNARQRARLDSLENLVTARLALLDALAATVDSEGAEAAQAQVARPAGQRFTTEIGDLFSALEHEERQLLSGRIEETRANADTATMMLVGNGILTLLMLAGVSFLFNRDVTRQERDEHRLRTALLAADAANDTKTRFLATVSHEIRTPLNAISGMSELLLDSHLNSEQTEFARTVHSNAEALAILIGDLLDSSKIEAGQVDLESAPFDLRELVEGVAEILVVRAEIKGLELIVDLSPEGPWHFLGDRNRLRQVVMNLVGNAVKFTEQGEVTVRVRAELTGDRRAAKVCLQVIDTGIGIAPEAQSRIFERFVQAERSTVRRYGGTGLGLNISRSLLELMGGTLSLDSQPGRGSTFEADVTMPLADTQPPAAFQPSSLAGIDVLLVEPHDTLRDALARVLRYAGASVRAVSTGGEAMTESGAARVIIVGESLPDSTGLEFARTLSSQRGTAGTPDASLVLLCTLRSMMTGYVGRYGIATCVYKPVKQARLIEAVRHAAGLAVEPATPTADDGLAPVPGGPAGPRILLVEDHRDNWTLATRILVAAGYDVDLAENGVKAVELASAYRYDLILMDIELPLLDGIEATRRIRQQERESREPSVPIVALTAHAVEQVRNEALAAGMDDYTTKPIHRKHLLEVCSRWIDKQPLILIADDSPENHVLLTNYLSGSDYRLVSAYNGQEAVAAFTRQRVSLVLLDIDMPLMNGYDAAAAIRRARGGGAVPIVALTGYEGAEERQRCLRAGCTGYLAKPIHRNELLATIGKLLGRTDSRSASRISDPAAVTRRANGEPVDAAPGAAVLPSSREASHQVHRLLAWRDFDALAKFASALAATATTLHLSKLATVSEELADAARHEDEPRSALWGDQLAAVLREAQRIVEVRHSTGGEADDAYDALARTASTLLGVPIAAITLLDEERLRIKGAAGVPAPFDTVRELPLSHSLCRIVAAQGSPLLVEDARTDPRVQSTPAVVDHGLVSYGGVPLTNAQGMTLGAFCAMDPRPHRWRPEDVTVLEDLAAVAMRMIEMERLLVKPASEATAPATPAPAPVPALERRPDAAPVAVPVVVDDDIADLLPAYVTSRRADVETLRALLEAGDVDGIRHLGHKMKGSGEGYGLPEVSRIGRTLEHAAPLGDTASIRDAIANLDALLARVSIRSTDGRVVIEP